MSRKQELLDAEDRGWRELHARVSRVPADAWERPGVNAEWTPKDILAHVAVWHAHATDRLEALRATGDLPAGPADQEAVDRFNEQEYQRCRDLPVDDARVMFEASRHRFREEMALLGDDVPERVARIIRANGDEHYDEHIPQLDAFLEAL